MTLLEIPGIVLPPNTEQLEDGDFDVEELVKRLAEVLIDEPQRNETLQLAGDGAVLIIECLDKGNEIIPRSWILSSYCALGRLVRYLQNRSRNSGTLHAIDSRGCRYFPRTYWINPTTITPPSEAYTSGTRA